MKWHQAQAKEAISAQNDVLTGIEESLHFNSGTLNVLPQSIANIEKMLEALGRFVVDQQYMATNSRFFAAPDPTLEKGITLEDALGKVITINWELVKSWKVSRALLFDVRFHMLIATVLRSPPCTSVRGPQGLWHGYTTAVCPRRKLHRSRHRQKHPLELCRAAGDENRHECSLSK